MRATHGATAFALAFLAGRAGAVTIAGPLKNPATGHNYYLLSYNTWTASESEALTLGGHLVTINNAAENQWVYNTFIPIASSYDPIFIKGNVRLWIGLSDAAIEGIFEWRNGEPVFYTHWDVGQPNSAGGDQDYVQMYGPVSQFGNQHPGFWNDFLDTDSTSDPSVGNFGVVEVVPEPSSFALLAFGSVGIALFRRRK